MDHKALCSAASKVIDLVEKQKLTHVSPDIITSIKNQMVFIRDNAAVGKNPSNELTTGTKFTYAILASRELTSPDDIALNQLIDEVTKILLAR